MLSHLVVSDSFVHYGVWPARLLSMGFIRQGYWNGLPFSPSGDLPDPGIEDVSPVSPALQADSLPTEPLGKSCCL